MASQAGPVVSTSEKRVACTICRRRKTACDRARPKCATCAKHGFDCEYIASERQPGLRAGYVSELEKRIDQLEARLLMVERNPLLSPGQMHVTSQAEIDFNASPELIQLEDDGSVTASHSIVHTTGTSYDHGTGNEGHSDAMDESPTVGSHDIGHNLMLRFIRFWFDRYHDSFPILHQPSIAAEMQTIHDINDSSRIIVYEAISIVALHYQHFPTLDIRSYRPWAVEKSIDILIRALDTLDLFSLQALLILSIDHYGKGELHKTSCILATCRRICDHLKLPQLADQHTFRKRSNYADLDIVHEEQIRALSMTEMLDQMLSIGGNFSISSSTLPNRRHFPCSDRLWDHTPGTDLEQPSRPLKYQSSFALCISLLVEEVPIVQSFLQRPTNINNFDLRDAWQSDAQKLDERLTIWRDDFVACVYKLINAEYTDHERPEMDPYFVLTNCVLNTTVITLLQARTPLPIGISQPTDPWLYATARCAYACENTAFKIRQMAEEELITCNPQLISSIFSAARFYVVHSKTMNADVPTNVHSLAFALHTCAKRWPIARVYETTIRTAVSEYRTPVHASRVPREFYDLTLPTIAIHPTLMAWAASVPSESTLVETPSTIGAISG